MSGGHGARPVASGWAIDREHGVIDEYGEIHGYQGLYVVDGAAVPSATGVNPSASILAMAGAQR